MKNCALVVSALLASCLAGCNGASTEAPAFGSKSDHDAPRRFNVLDQHNLMSAAKDGWVVYAWTDAKAYRLGEPIQFHCRFVTDVEGDCRAAKLTVALKDDKGTVRHSHSEAITPVLVRREPPACSVETLGGVGASNGA